MVQLQGVYFIQNARVPINIDLTGPGSPDNGAEITGWKQKLWNHATNFDASNQLWLIKPVADHTDMYTLQNIKGGTYLDMEEGGTGNGNRIVGWHGAPSRISRL
ncbi:hypothetical protein PM082_013988 [Marasmius tenuissimus]|nr:hypothetical protein PM082_013988 [Marasmius tenuissimus]